MWSISCLCCLHASIVLDFHTEKIISDSTGIHFTVRAIGLQEQNAYL